MKRIGLLFTVVFIASAIVSCERNSQSKDLVVKVPMNPNDSLFVVSEGGYDFSIYLPKDLMIENTPEIRFNNATGDLHIRIGEQFWIVASQESKDISALKAEINNDMLFTSRIIEENKHSILYQRLLPDGSAYDYNYRNLCNVSGKSYFFKTCEEGEYSMKSVDLMKSAINSVHPRV